MIGLNGGGGCRHASTVRAGMAALNEQLHAEAAAEQQHKKDLSVPARV